MTRLIVILLIILSSKSWSQNSVGLVFEEYQIDSTVGLRNHTSLKPLIRQNTGGKKTVFEGISDLNFKYNTDASYKTGLGASYVGNYNKWYFRIAAVQGVSDSNFLPKSYLSWDQNGLNLYTDIRSRISFTPNHIFNFQAGVDHNFIGEGSRSLFLSDYGKPYPFGLIRANFWRFEYSVLYQFMRERDAQRWESKFMSSHHISFNATKWLNIGIFESVIFQPKDTNLVRGFDIEYLNPLVFYRPQEYTLGSSDNVLLGLDITGKWRKNVFYGQLILDEFYLAELRAKSGWWANKFGGQVGAKGEISLGGESLFYRLEYNFVRPYTFSHISEELNYGNQGDPLAHPYGSNFMEVLGEAKWQKKKWSAKIFASYYLRGYDRDGFSFGGDIYQSYVDRPFEYGHHIGQGTPYNGSKLMLTGAYKISKHGNLHLFLENHLDYYVQTSKWNYAAVAGIRSLLWNDYRNY